MLSEKLFVPRFSTCRVRRKAARRVTGLTTVEAVCMTVILGLMSGLAYPAITGLRQAGLDQQAIGIAQALNQAQQTYNLRVANAESTWEAAPDSPSKYQLISQYVPYAADTLTDYEPTGYTIALGSTLNTKVTVTGPTGPISY
jgi:type II secretory pathway pseudopilin PulG